MRKAVLLILTLIIPISSSDLPYNPTPDRYVDIHHSKIDIRVDLVDSTVVGNVTHIMS